MAQRFFLGFCEVSPFPPNIYLQLTDEIGWNRSYLRHRLQPVVHSARELSPYRHLVVV
jgi:hypothetical protein